MGSDSRGSQPGVPIAVGLPASSGHRSASKWLLPLGVLLRQGLCWGARAARTHRWRVWMMSGILLSLAVAASVVIYGALEGRGAGSHAHAPARALGVGEYRPSSASIRRLSLEREVRERWLASAPARAQRLASRMAFHDASGLQARKILLTHYGLLLAQTSANAAASLASMGRVVSYIGNKRAIVQTPRGLEAVSSTMPLRVAHGAAAPKPVKLGLTARKSRFAPINPLVPVSIARTSQGGVTVGAEGLRVTLQGADVTGQVVADRDVFFGNSLPDTDAVVAPKIGGAELFAVLRSRESPEQLRYTVSLPYGARLQAADGGAVVSRAGSPLARIAAPSARDAQGTVVPVTMTVTHDELLLQIPHRTRDLAYPLLVDPEVTNIASSLAGWTASSEPYRGCAELPRIEETGVPLTITSPSTSYPRPEEKSCKESSRNYEFAYGGWLYDSSAVVHTVEFYGVSLAFTATSEGHEYGEGAEWHLGGCGEGVSGYNSTPPAPIVTVPPAKGCEEKTVFIGLAAGLLGGHRPASATVSGSLSVEAVLTTEPLPPVEKEEVIGEENESEPERTYCKQGHPVNCATGNQTETQVDFLVGGRGPTLGVTRAYNSQLAVTQGEHHEHGAFGYGWTGPYSAHLTFGEICRPACVATVTVHQDNGSTVAFEHPSTTYQPVAMLVQSTLVKEGSEYVFTLPDQRLMRFNSTGQLTSESDRDGNTLSFAYGSGKLETITDAAGRKIKLAYNSEGLVSSAEDPMGHVVKYTYESENLVSVTQPSETALRWQYEYNAEHEMTSETDGRKDSTTTEYDSSHRVISQTGPMGRERKWEYSGTFGTEPTTTTITEPNGSVTREEFNVAGLPTRVTRAYGTSLATNTSFEYDIEDNLVSVTDPDKHTTEYRYDSAGDRTSEKNADGDETKWTYDSTHDIETITTPDGETTTIRRESHGNPETVERPAPGSKTQVTKYKYDGHGDLENVTNPLEHTWKYEYDSYGDRTAEIDPEGDKHTWEYNEDSQETASVIPRGYAEGAEISKFTTKIERDAQGQPLIVTGPFGRKTTYTYDGDGDLETQTDPNGDKTKYTYDSDNELVKLEEPNKTVIETGYDSESQVTSQIDGNKHTTKYVRNALERVTEVVDPRERKTTNEYDAAGNLLKITDPAKRTTTYKYDPANRLQEISYSDGKTHTVQYEYNKDDKVTQMTDASGTTKYTYDQLDRLTEVENGHKETVKHEYDLADDLTKITYPNGKTVIHTYDKDGRLAKVTDWLEHTATFSYNLDSDVNKIAFPSATGEEDKYSYNEADEISEVKMLKSTETLASLIYTRDSDGNVKAVTSKGLPGEEKPAYEYDKNNRLTIGAGLAYEYDAANNPTKQGSGTYKYNAADELEESTGYKYTYNEDGQRTKTTPTTGPATTYGYDQAGNLTSVERPKEGSTPEIKDSYAYNGEGLRTSETISGTTSYLTWDTAEPLPLPLTDGTNSYIYGPDGLPIEQINNTTGTVEYLHHDQQGSTRLLTGSTGTVTGKCSYSAYGTPTCEGSATTPLGWDGQYTSSDTGLVYLRNRVYDPSTAQFLSVDPAVALTREPYAYGGDNPVNRRDPDGLSAEGLEGVPCYFPFCGPPPPAVEGVQHGIEGVTHGIESVWNSVNENEGPNDEGEAELKEKEAQRECGEPNRGSLEKLKQREIDRILDEAGTDAHTDKEQTVGEGEAGHYDYYRDKSTGEIYLVPKSGGEPIPTGLGG